MKTDKRAALIRAAAKDKDFANAAGISQRVAQQMCRAEKRRAKTKPPKTK